MAVPKPQQWPTDTMASINQTIGVVVGVVVVVVVGVVVDVVVGVVVGVVAGVVVGGTFAKGSVEQSRTESQSGRHQDDGGR
jgi:hypothetical protein